MKGLFFNETWLTHTHTHTFFCGAEVGQWLISNGTVATLMRYSTDLTVRWVISSSVLIFTVRNAAVVGMDKCKLVIMNYKFEPERIQKCDL